MDTIFCGLLLGLSVFNLLGIWLIYYFVSRNWDELIDQRNYIININTEVMRNSMKQDEVICKIVEKIREEIEKYQQEEGIRNE